MTFRTLLGATVEGSGPLTVVFANGFATTKASWDAVLPAVPRPFRIVRFDYVGTTPETTDRWIPERYATYHGHADDLRRLLLELDCRDVCFVGHSMSGMVGAIAAAADPELFGHLVLIGASPCYRREAGYDGGFTAADIADLMLRANADLAAWMGGFAPTLLGTDAEPHQLREYLQTLLAIRPDIGRALLRSIFTSDFRGVLPAVQAPVTVVGTTSDVAVPIGVTRYLGAHLPARTVHELEVTGHLPHVTHPSLVQPILRSVLEDFAAARSDVRH